MTSRSRESCRKSFPRTSFCGLRCPRQLYVWGPKVHRECESVNRALITTLRHEGDAVRYSAELAEYEKLQDQVKNTAEGAQPSNHWCNHLQTITVYLSGGREKQIHVLQISREGSAGTALDRLRSSAVSWCRVKMRISERQVRTEACRVRTELLHLQHLGGEEPAPGGPVHHAGVPRQRHRLQAFLRGR
ncbi:uncharacterized protein LOC120986696 isoform X8 [Bufo bufo]|uniref:uncharacterized protein LOC120986696 isoform X8 n=1 Tax=Bufo bufo TaxID=8384 RepID=UPI001ABE3A1A|nr:uncharacterized protein LOC120986696 isoform X8 [Bufo bufo]XP_040271318.1 uncharacterized protein LOC120986696 isoform X8 [Bufo bufo]